MALNRGVITHPVLRPSVAGLQETDQGLPAIASTLHVLTVPRSESSVGVLVEISVRHPAIVWSAPWWIGRPWSRLRLSLWPLWRRVRPSESLGMKCNDVG